TPWLGWSQVHRAEGQNSDATPGSVFTCRRQRITSVLAIASQADSQRHSREDLLRQALPLSKRRVPGSVSPNLIRRRTLIPRRSAAPCAGPGAGLVTQSDVGLGMGPGEYVPRLQARTARAGSDSCPAA